MDAHLSLIELAIWFGAAFPLWLLLIATLDRLGSPIPALLGAPLSWVLARFLMSGVPELIRWAADVLSMTG